MWARVCRWKEDAQSEARIEPRRQQGSPNAPASTPPLHSAGASAILRCTCPWQGFAHALYKKEAAGAQASAWLRFGPAEQAVSFFWPNHGKENPAGSPFEEGAVTGYFRRNRFGLAAYAATEYGLFMARGRKAKKLRAIMRRRLETREFSRR